MDGRPNIETKLRFQISRRSVVKVKFAYEPRPELIPVSVALSD